MIAPLSISIQMFFIASAAGSLIAVIFYKIAETAWAQKFSDLIWILIGGISAITAFSYGGYIAHSEALRRQSTTYISELEDFEISALDFAHSNCAENRNSARLGAKNLNQACLRNI